MDRDFLFHLDCRDVCISFQPPATHTKKTKDTIKCQINISSFGLYLCQEVLLWILMERRYCPPRPKPGINRDVVLISLSKTTIIWNTNIFLQLWNLVEYRSKLLQHMTIFKSQTFAVVIRLDINISFTLEFILVKTIKDLMYYSHANMFTATIMMMVAGP